MLYIARYLYLAGIGLSQPIGIPRVEKICIKEYIQAHALGIAP
jgi:hypothetical protein